MVGAINLSQKWFSFQCGSETVRGVTALWETQASPATSPPTSVSVCVGAPLSARPRAHASQGTGLPRRPRWARLPGGGWGQKQNVSLIFFVK